MVRSFCEGGQKMSQSAPNTAVLAVGGGDTTKYHLPTNVASSTSRMIAMNQCVSCVGTYSR
jgi:hypothetical protein